jgi:hypothetical protein
MDKYKNLTSKGKVAYLEALKNIGWFDFSNNTKEEIGDRIDHELNKSKENADFMFCLYDLWFDREGFEEDDDYKFLLEEIIEIIKLNCKLTVEYSKFENNIKIQIKTENNVYTYYVNNFRYVSGWIDEKIIEVYINYDLLYGEKTNKIFIELPSSDQTVQFVYMPEEIYKKAIEVGIIPEDKDYFNYYRK